VIIEVHDVDRKPFILIFTVRKLDDLSQTTSAQSCLRILSQLIACCALRGVSRSELVSRPLINGRDEGSHLAFASGGDVKTE